MQAEWQALELLCTGRLTSQFLQAVGHPAQRDASRCPSARAAEGVVVLCIHVFIICELLILVACLLIFIWITCELLVLGLACLVVHHERTQITGVEPHVACWLPHARGITPDLKF